MQRHTGLDCASHNSACWPSDLMLPHLSVCLSRPLLLTCLMDVCVCVCVKRADTADVHSPGVPRDCAALEGLHEPDLTALASAARHDTAGGAAAGNGAAAAEETGAGRTGGTDAAVDMDAALSRLQEVGGVGCSGGWADETQVTGSISGCSSHYEQPLSRPVLNSRVFHIVLVVVVCALSADCCRFAPHCSTARTGCASGSRSTSCCPQMRPASRAPATAAPSASTAGAPPAHTC